MFRSKLFWSDYFEDKPSKPARSSHRIVSAAKVGGIGLMGVVAALLFVVVLLRWVPVPTSAFMLGQMLRGNSIEYDWVPLSKIAPSMPISVVAAEDQRFPDHYGFDFEAISDAMKQNRRRNRPRGASTISQQVAKNLFLWSGRSWVRKGLEAGLTVAIEQCWPKRRILEVYLNIAQFGPNTFGVAAASQHYFGKPPSRLNAYQAALLAAVLPNPKKYKVRPPSSYVWQRAADIQEQVRLLGGPAYLAGL
ncbi:MAG: monofunctional biosynthetic peptidoglycan transglycosylase [Desulfatitalea sp.]